ncbi:MAG: SGNH/GDSL hydrolase family protein [Lentisphaeria bacterium]|nr:SGNH/GDSL hydrolase family protein [Lentisphaeria bacterium]
MKVESNSKFIFIGDSITDAGRSESGEETPWNLDKGLGRGYVNLINAKIMSETPECRVRIINKGISGNTILDLQRRWQDDVLKLKPDYLSIKIGINDVWRQFDVPHQVEIQVSMGVYEKTYISLLEKTRASLKGLVLISPYLINNNKQDLMRQQIDAYSDIVSKLAKKFDAVHITPQVAIDNYLLHYHASSLAWDSIHPNTSGHMMIANEFFKQVSF